MPTICLSRRHNDIPLFVADVMAYADSERIFYYRTETPRSVTFHFRTIDDRDLVARFIDREDYRQTVF